MKNFSLLAFVALMACSPEKQPVRLIVLDPGHFHASLVMQGMYPGIDSTARVFAPDGPEVKQYLASVEKYNQRAEQPTHWHTDVYTGPDYLEQLGAQPAGNIVIIAGNNRLKSSYIRRSVHAGMHVMSDKPMAIDAAGFDSLKAAFEEAAAKKVQLFDMMTERYEIVSILQKEIAQMPAVFGTLEKGSASDPAVIRESVHHFKKNVAGRLLIRPTWYMDVNQQGEGIVDVTTHMVDLIQWTCFPEQVIDYTKDIQVDSARRWPTAMTAQQFADITGQPAAQNDSVLQVYANGAFDYRLRGVHARVSVTWKYEGEGGDTHYSFMRGTKASVLLKDGELFVQTSATDSAALQPLLQKYPGVTLERTGSGWRIVIPDSYKKGHEASFAKVMEAFLGYVKEGNMPAWEVPNTLAKYYTTTEALKLAKKRN